MSISSTFHSMVPIHFTNLNDWASQQPLAGNLSFPNGLAEAKRDKETCSRSDSKCLLVLGLEPSSPIYTSCCSNPLGENISKKCLLPWPFLFLAGKSQGLIYSKRHPFKAWPTVNCADFCAPPPLSHITNEIVTVLTLKSCSLSVWVNPSLKWMGRRLSALVTLGSRLSAVSLQS